MAWGLKELRELLTKLDEWGRIREAMARIPDLEKRVQELEQKLAGDYPPEVCKFCGKRAARLANSRVDDAKTGMVREDWACSDCGREEARMERPRTR